jgi:hypothetical protein
LIISRSSTTSQALPLSPWALWRLLRRLILVLLTLLGALPIYRRVEEESPHGEGSISMLAALMSDLQYMSAVFKLKPE